MYYHRLIFFIPAVVVMLSAEAVTVYRKVDENGVVVFSDEPFPGAVPVEVMSPKVEKDAKQWRLPGQPGGPSVRPSSGEAPDTFTEYRTVTITTPTAGTAVRGNNGQLSVNVALEPDLAQGHRILYYMDNQLVASNSGTSASLPGVENGNHTLFAAVVNQDGLELTRSKPVSFDFLRKTNNVKPGDGEPIPPQLSKEFEGERTQPFETNNPKRFESNRPGEFEQKRPGEFQRKPPGEFQRNPPKKWNPPRPSSQGN